MTDWTTIRVKTAARDEAKERKEEDTTWSEWITDEQRGMPDTEELADELVDRLDYAEISDSVAEEVIRELRQ